MGFSSPMPAPNEPGAQEAQEVFGPYLVHERLGVGGMATVHRAMERGIEGFERIVALKRLLPHLAEDASFVKAFVREAKLASLLQHANIVQLFELGRVGTQYFISMEYIDGRDIRQVLRQARRVSGPPTINVTIALLIQLCDALEYAHTRMDAAGEPLGLVHRDVSPSNLLVTRSGHLKVIDFGIAKAQSSQLRTATGRVKGKLAYMAPEAIAGKDLDARSDIFSAGVIAHELLTARPLFASKNEYQTIVNVQKAEILPPSAFNQAVPPELDHVVLRALARDREQRYGSAAQMRDDLHAIRIRYQLSATNREVQTWLEWAFTLESSGGNFSGMTDAFGQSQSPVASLSAVAAMPMPASTPPRGPDLSRTPVAALAATARGKPPPEEDEAADHAWGGHKEHDTGQPVVLDDVPDHSHRRPGYTGGAAAAAAGLDDEAPTPLPPPPPLADTRAGAAPDDWPQGSSADAVGKIRGSARFGSVVTANPVTATTPPIAAAVEPMPVADTAPVVAPVVAPALGSFGASIVQRKKSPAPLVLAGLAIAAVAAAAVYVIPRMKGGEKTARPVITEAPPATLKFIVEPGDATIKIAGMEPHQGAPWSIQLEPGVAQVKISRDGHLSWETSIELSSNETQTVRVVLGPAPAGTDATQARLELSSEPVGLAILLDGHDTGARTPTTMPLPPGTHTLSLRQYGEIVWRHTFDAEAGTLYQFSPSMSQSKRAERAARERQPAGDHERVATGFGGERPAPPGPTPVELLGSRPGSTAGSAVAPTGPGSAVTPTGPGSAASATGPGSAAGSASIVKPPVGPGSAAGSASIVKPPVGPGSAAGSASIVKPPVGPGSAAGSAGVVKPPVGPGSAAGSAAIVKPPVGPGSAAGTGPGSAAIAVKPPTPPAAPAPTTVPIVPPTSVKRVSGALPQISTINRTGAELPKSATAKICIDRNGVVTSVQVLKLTGEIADKIASAIRTWRYTPYLLDGKPSGACFVNAFTLGAPKPD
jgi:serine/threonine protein kinase